MSTIINRILAYGLMIMLLAAAIYLAGAAEVPLGAETVNEEYDETVNLSNWVPDSIEAYAGNISRLNITGSSQTKHWQGYFGDITGTIILDDADGWTLYDWPNPEPKGEIYATVNDTIDWQSVNCFNYSEVILDSLNQTTYWENFYNMTFNDVDGIDETFNLTTHPTFDVGDVTVVTCPTTYTHVTDLFQTDKFVEVILQDDAGMLIFSTIIENDDEGNNTDPIGYNDQMHDFQLLVAEDGTSRVAGQRNQATTTYYFFVDIE